MYKYYKIDKKKPKGKHFHYKHESVCLSLEVEQHKICYFEASFLKLNHCFHICANTVKHRCSLLTYYFNRLCHFIMSFEHAIIKTTTLHPMIKKYIPLVVSKTPTKAHTPRF